MLLKDSSTKVNKYKKQDLVQEENFKNVWIYFEKIKGDRLSFIQI